MDVKFKKLVASVATPKYANKDDACFDLAVIVDDMLPPAQRYGSYEHQQRPMSLNGKAFVSIEPNQTIVFHTGLAFEVPSGHVMLIYARSSTGFNKQIALTNGTGVIDSGYRGEVRIALTNIGQSTMPIYDGDRVAQACIVPLPEVELKESETLTDSERGTNGIGSSGV